MKEPANLAKISPAKFSPLVEFSGDLRDGARATIKIAPLGIPLFSWVAVFSEVQSSGDKRKFVDTQEKGPFAFWRHQHIFEAGQQWIEGRRSGSKVKFEQPGTWMRDRVEYEPPAGPLGDLLDKIRIRLELENLFAYRYEKLREFFPLI
jgi:ligand-binding SRPBCC domain-containing protein